MSKPTTRRTGPPALPTFKTGDRVRAYIDGKERTGIIVDGADGAPTLWGLIRMYDHVVEANGVRYGVWDHELIHVAKEDGA